MSTLWLREQLLARGLALRTVDTYARVIRDAESWCIDHGTTLKAIEGLVLLRYVESKPETHSTRKLLLCALRHYWAIVGRRRPPAWAIRQLPKPDAECKALDEDDADRLEYLARHWPDVRKGLVVLLALYTGLRRAELAALAWSAFRADGNVRVIGKGGRQRDIPIHDELAPAIAAYRAIAGAGAFLFPGRFGGPVNPATVWAWVREVAAAADLELAGSVPPHRLRHTCLAEINDATGNLRATQAIAGHRRPETTATYTRATVRTKRAAIASLSYGRRQKVLVARVGDHPTPSVPEPPGSIMRLF